MYKLIVNSVVLNSILKKKISIYKLIVNYVVLNNIWTKKKFDIQTGFVSVGEVY